MPPESGQPADRCGRRAPAAIASDRIPSTKRPRVRFLTSLPPPERRGSDDRCSWLRVMRLVCIPKTSSDKIFQKKDIQNIFLASSGVYSAVTSGEYVYSSSFSTLLHSGGRFCSTTNVYAEIKSLKTDIATMKSHACSLPEMQCAQRPSSW